MAVIQLVQNQFVPSLGVRAALTCTVVPGEILSAPTEVARNNRGQIVRELKPPGKNPHTACPRWPASKKLAEQEQTAFTGHR